MKELSIITGLIVAGISGYYLINKPKDEDENENEDEFATGTGAGASLPAPLSKKSADENVDYEEMASGLEPPSTNYFIDAGKGKGEGSKKDDIGLTTGVTKQPDDTEPEKEQDKNKSKKDMTFDEKDKKERQDKKISGTSGSKIKKSMTYDRDEDKDKKKDKTMSGSEIKKHMKKQPKGTDILSSMQKKANDKSISPLAS